MADTRTIHHIADVVDTINATNNTINTRLYNKTRRRLKLAGLLLGSIIICILQIIIILFVCSEYCRIVHRVIQNNNNSNSRINYSDVVGSFSLYARVVFHLSQYFCRQPTGFVEVKEKLIKRVFLFVFVLSIEIIINK